MPKKVTVALLVMIATLSTLQTVQSAEDAEPKVRFLVPAYFYPAGAGLKTWERLIQSASRVPTVAIVNPGSGPGKRIDSNYTNVFKAAKDSKITLIGYVTLSYAKRPLSTIKAEVDTWLRLYPEVDGIFFDEQPSGAESVNFVHESWQYARDKIEDATVFSNPGVVCAKEYFTTKFPVTVCMFEHEKGFDKYQPPAWTADIDSERIAVLHYSISTADQMRTVLKSAVEKRSGYLFLTNHTGPMPWGGLPSYWEEEIVEVSRLNQPIITK